jgi:hypothetical protein
MMVAASPVWVSPSTRTLGIPAPSGAQLATADAPPHVVQTIAPPSVPM